MMAATWGGGANSPVAATGNLDDFSKGCAGTNSLIRHDIIRGIDIFLPISEYIVIISFNENTSGENSLCPIRRKRVGRVTLVSGLVGVQTAPTVVTAIADQVSDS